MHWSVWAVVTEEHTLGGLNYRYLLSHSCRKLEAPTSVSADLVSGEGLISGSQTTVFCVLIWQKGQGAPRGIFYKGTNAINIRVLPS